jgi:hypothetical protein
VGLLAAAALLAVGCGQKERPEATRQPPARLGSGAVAGTGFTTRQPEGFSGVGTREVTGTVLGLIGRFEGRAGSAPSINVSRSPLPPDTRPSRLRKSIEDQSQGQGARRLKRLPGRRVDAEKAVGVIFEVTASNGSETTRRTYAVQHERFVYTIASTEPGKDDPKPLDTVLDSWRWKD